MAGSDRCDVGPADPCRPVKGCRGEPGRTQLVGVARLTEHRQIAWHDTERRLIEVIGVQVRNKHYVRTVQHFVDRARQIDCRVPLGRVSHRPDRTPDAQHRIDQKLRACESQPQRGVSNETQIHFVEATSMPLRTALSERFGSHLTARPSSLLN